MIRTWAPIECEVIQLRRYINPLPLLPFLHDAERDPLVIAKILVAVNCVCALIMAKATAVKYFPV